ncbi:MAG: histidine kinase [Polyangiales bacterium]
MDARDLIIEVSEKSALMATAGLVSVLVPQLRNRLLGVGRPRDLVVVFFFGVLLSMWGAKMGVALQGHHLNLRAFGIMTAGLLGGPGVGATVGVVAGLFYLFRVHPDVGFMAIVISVIDGAGIGWFARRSPASIMTWRAFGYAAWVQFISLGVLFTDDIVSGELNPIASSAAFGVQLVANAAGFAIFVNVARVVLGREEQAVALVQAKADADKHALQALRRRLEPHFLFNALNTIRATIRHDPSRARELVSGLADLYRYLLHHPDDAPLHDEVRHACDYLVIEQARFGSSRIEIASDVQSDVRNVLIPALTLQPIVENAVHHGVARRSGKATISIEAKREGEFARIQIIDQTEGPEASATHDGAKIAINNLRERLDTRYRGKASLLFEPVENGMMVVVLIPLESEHP